ncbi:dicarboxylate/amino acid:cation symporter [Luteococcus sp. H138]|uniref:dicarboxylate/amino acid:cation symporter n=1 Tax=unclassified Luteococcus TaxID=2639923 RepID=UPI00313E5E74
MSTPTSAPSPAAEATPAPRPRRGIPFWAKVFIGLAVGIVLGYLARRYQLEWLTELLVTVGSVFVSLLKAVVVPLVLFALVVSISNLRQVNNAAKLAVNTLVWFGITAAVSVAIGITIGLLTNPGANASIDTAGAQAVATQGSWLDFLKSLVPSNILGLQVDSSLKGEGANVAVTSTLSFNVLQVVVIGIALGAAALAVGEQVAAPFVNFATAGLEIFQKLTWWIILLAPIGSAGLIGKAVANYGWDLVAPLGIFTLDVYLGCALVMFVMYPALLALHGLNPITFFKGAGQAIQLAFVSRSSVGTLPVTQQNVIDRLGVPREYASFAVPIGATTKMDGCASIYPALAAITVAQLFDVPLGLTDYLLIAFVSVVGSAATAGLTGAIVMLTLTLSTLGLPLEGVGLLLAIDPILDMMRTATNVAGQAAIPVIVAKRAGILDEAVYNGQRSAHDPAGPTAQREGATV